MRNLSILCILALALALSAPAFAEVQNVKVSGDITVRGIFQEDFDLNDDNTGTTGNEEGFLSFVRLRVDADLTDNVSAMIRILNQRQWDTEIASDTALVIDSAYITLKELLYSPLTVTIGRQDVVYGDGFIVGAGRLQDIEGALADYNQYSMDNGHDAITAVLDYDPVTISIIYSKINETDLDGTAGSYDRTLYGGELSYDFDSYDANLTGYFLVDDDGAFAEQITDGGDPAFQNVHQYEESITYCLGLRGDVTPIDNLDLQGEIAFQLGEISDTFQNGTITDQADPANRDREAWALDVAGEYSWADVTYAPSLLLEYVYRSGEERANTGDYEAWNEMFTGKFYGLIYDFLQGTNSVTNNTNSGIYATDDASDTNPTSNNHLIKIAGTIQPIDDLSVELAWLGIWFDEEPVASRDDEIGQEIDIIAVYDYTEDVQFALAAGWFLPGDYYQAGSDDNATSVMGSVSVEF